MLTNCYHENQNIFTYDDFWSQNQIFNPAWLFLLY